MQGYLFQGQKEKIQAKRMRLNIAVEITEEVDYAGTITLPIGQSAMPASFTCAQTKGMPTMVDQA